MKRNKVVCTSVCVYPHHTHTHTHSHTHTQSPEWDSRSRSVTAPMDPTSFSSLSTSLTYSTPTTHPVAPVVDLPPLPGEYAAGTPPRPVPKKMEGEDGLHPPSLPRKGYTLPRKNMSQYLCVIARVF